MYRIYLIFSRFMRCIGSFKCIFWKMDTASLPSEALFWKNPPLTHRSPSTKYFCKTADCDRLHSLHQFFSPSKSFNFQCFQSADRTCITTILKFILYSQGLFIYIHPPLPKIYKLLAWYFISILHLVAITPLKYCAK